MRHVLLCLSLAAITVTAGAQQLAQDLHESVSSLDVKVKDFYGREETGRVILTQFKPDGNGPFPILILNHGRSGTNRSDPPRFRYIKQVKFFTERGFAVFEPTHHGADAMDLRGK